MHNFRKINDDVYYVGASDRRLALFENIYPIERGVSYNSYLVLDEKTVLLDTTDHSVSREFLENVETVLADFDLRKYFKSIVESAVVGVRKPDPRIFSLGVEALGLQPENVLSDMNFSNA